MGRTGLLDEVSRDVRVLFRKRLNFDIFERGQPEKWVETPLQVGAVTLGFLSLPASQSQERNRAYRHWLKMVCQNIAQDLGSPHPQPSDVLPAKVTQAARFVRERFEEKTSLAEVAGDVGLSRERLSRLFHESLGITFSDYLNEVRLGHARRRLASEDESITNVAYSSGFQSLSQFNRRFKAAEGMSPSEYRRRHAASAAAARRVG